MDQKYTLDKPYNIAQTPMEHLYFSMTFKGNEI